MFGYIGTIESELKVREAASYKSWYCGLCQCMKRNYGLFSPLFLQYDCAFLALLFSGELGETVDAKRCHCLHRCHDPHRKYRLETPALRFSAAVNVFLAYYKCLDDWQDEHKLPALAEAKTLEPWYREVQARYPRQCQAITQAMAALAEIEKRGEEAPDAAAACFGDLMAEVLVWREDRWSGTLRSMGHALGRFIYLVDAADDLAADTRSGAYNPLPLRYGLPGGTLTPESRAALVYFFRNLGSSNLPSLMQLMMAAMSVSVRWLTVLRGLMLSPFR